MDPIECVALFPQGLGGACTAKYAGIWGNNLLLYYFPIYPHPTCGNGVTPQVHITLEEFPIPDYFQVSLHTDRPNDKGSHEVTYAGYARVQFARHKERDWRQVRDTQNLRVVDFDPYIHQPEDEDEDEDAITDEDIIQAYEAYMQQGDTTQAARPWRTLRVGTQEVDWSDVQDAWARGLQARTEAAALESRRKEKAQFPVQLDGEDHLLGV